MHYDDEQIWPEDVDYYRGNETKKIDNFHEEFNGWHPGRTEVSETQGSRTLPRASGGGNKAKKNSRSKVCLVTECILYTILRNF